MSGAARETELFKTFPGKARRQPSRGSTPVLSGAFTPVPLHQAGGHAVAQCVKCSAALWMDGWVGRGSCCEQKGREEPARRRGRQAEVMIDSPSSHVVDGLKAHGDELVGVGSALDFLAQDEDVVQDGELRERPVCGKRSATLSVQENAWMQSMRAEEHRS